MFQMLNRKKIRRFQKIILKRSDSLCAYTSSHGSSKNKFSLTSKMNEKIEM